MTWVASRMLCLTRSVAAKDYIMPFEVQSTMKVKMQRRKKELSWI